MPYTPTTWVNDVTQVSAANLNNMEAGIENAIPKDIAGVATDKVPVYDGSDWVAQKILNAQIDSAAAIALSKLAINPSPTPATSLPGSPVDGQIAILTDSLTVPTYSWMFRYDTGLTTDAWTYLGGSPVMAHVQTTESRGSTYGDLTTPGPAVAVPVGGVYDVRWGFQYVQAHATAELLFMSFSGCGFTVGTHEASSGYVGGSANSQVMKAERTLRLTLTAGTLTTKYKTASAVGSFAQRELAVTPVSVP